jgi:hypothetical protein
VGKACQEASNQMQSEHQMELTDRPQPIMASDRVLMTRAVWSDARVRGAAESTNNRFKRGQIGPHIGQGEEAVVLLAHLCQRRSPTHTQQIASNLLEYACTCARHQSGRSHTW